MNADFEQVAENIGLVFSVAFLYMLYILWNRGWKEDHTVTLSSQEKLMMAAGLNVVTLSNPYITMHLEGNVCLACVMGDRERNKHNTDKRNGYKRGWYGVRWLCTHRTRGLHWC